MTASVLRLRAANKTLCYDDEEAHHLSLTYA